MSKGFDRLYNDIAACGFANGSDHEWKSKEEGGDRRSEFHVRCGVVDLGTLGIGFGIVAAFILYLQWLCPSFSLKLSGDLGGH
jgi:hypothetical protein